MAVQTLEQFSATLDSADSTTLRQAVVLPTVIQGRTAPEQAEFLQEALRDEITPEGLELLERKGRFGPLRDIFPEEADKWAAQGGVTMDDCVAFRLDRADAPRMELVLAGTAAPDAQTSTVQAPLRVLRCNNVTAPVQLRLSSTGNP